MKLTWNLDGCMVALEQAIRKDYFPQGTRETLQIFLSRQVVDVESNTILPHDWLRFTSSSFCTFWVLFVMLCQTYSCDCKFVWLKNLNEFYWALIISFYSPVHERHLKFQKHRILSYNFNLFRPSLSMDAFPATKHKLMNTLYQF